MATPTQEMVPLSDVAQRSIVDGLASAFNLEPNAISLLIGQLNNDTISLENTVLSVLPFVGPPDETMSFYVRHQRTNWLARSELAAIHAYHDELRFVPMRDFFAQFGKLWDARLFLALRSTVTRLEFRFADDGGGGRRLTDVIVQHTTTLYEQALQKGFNLRFSRVLAIAELIRNTEERIPKYVVTLPVVSGDKSKGIRELRLVAWFGEFLPESVRRELARASRSTLRQLQYCEDGAGNPVLIVAP